MLDQHAANQPRLSAMRIPPRAMLAAVAGLMFIAWIIAVLMSVNTPLPMIALCALCLGGIVVIRPSVGIGAVVVCAAVVKVEIGTGTNSPIVASLVAAVVLVAGWFVHRMLMHERINTLPPMLTVPIFGIVGFTLFAWMWGHATLDPRIVTPMNFYRVQIAQAMLIFVSIALLIVGGDLFKSRGARSLLSASIIVIGAFNLLFRQLFPESTGFLSSTTFNVFGLFGLWFVSICWGNALLNTRLTIHVRVILATLTGLWLYRSIVMDGLWVSGWLPPVLALLVITFFAGPKFILPLFIGIVGLVTAMFTYFYQLLVTSQMEEGSIGGDFGRLELWKRNIELSQDWILTGAGPAGYVLYYVTFIPNQAMSSHNNYLDILSQIGIGGLVSLVALLLGLAILAFRTWPRLSNPMDRAFCASTLGAVPALMMSLLFGDWLIPFVYNQTIAGFNHSVYSWLALAALVGLVVRTAELEQEGV